MADYGVSAGQFVAVIWDHSSPAEALKDLVEKLRTLTGGEGQVSVENISQLLQCECLHTSSLQAAGVGGMLHFCGSSMSELFWVADDSSGWPRCCFSVEIQWASECS